MLCLGICSYLEVLGAIWIYLVLFGSIWSHLKPFWDNWTHLGPLGAIYCHLKPYGAIVSQSSRLVGHSYLRKISRKNLRKIKESTLLPDVHLAWYAFTRFLQVLKSNLGPIWYYSLLPSSLVFCCNWLSCPMDVVFWAATTYFNVDSES